MGGRVPPEAKVGATTIAAAVAAVAVLEVLQQTVQAFNPRPEISALIVGAVFFATLALGVLQQRLTREDELDDALRAWPLPHAETADPYRLGVLPPRASGGGSGSAGYARRGDVEDRMEAAIGASTSAFVLVTGPDRAGKSRTALETAARALPDALVVAPMDGRALRELLDLDPPLFSRRSRLPKWSRSSRAVLWLDGLNRFLEEIDGDLLDEVRGNWMPVTIVGTIREAEYESALQGSGAEAEGAKVVAAEAEEFALPERRVTR